MCVCILVCACAHLHTTHAMHFEQSRFHDFRGSPLDRTHTARYTYDYAHAHARCVHAGNAPDYARATVHRTRGAHTHTRVHAFDDKYYTCMCTAHCCGGVTLKSMRGETHHTRLARAHGSRTLRICVHVCVCV